MACSEDSCTARSSTPTGSPPSPFQCLYFEVTIGEWNQLWKNGCFCEDICFKRVMNTCVILVGRKNFQHWEKLTLHSSFQNWIQNWLIPARKCILFSLYQKSTLTPRNNVAILELLTVVLVNTEEQVRGACQPHLPGEGLVMSLFGSCPCELWMCIPWNHLFLGVHLAHSITGMLSSRCYSVCNSVQRKINCCRTSEWLLSRQVVL